MNKKKFLVLLLALVLILAMSVTLFAACGNKEDGKGPGTDTGGTLIKFGREVKSGDDYELGIYGLSEEPYLISKGQIKEFYESNPDKRVIFDASNPCAPSDKTGDEYKHTAKGVALRDLLIEFCDGANIENTVSAELLALDTNRVILVNKQYLPSKADDEFTGSEMIIIFEYDGKLLDGKGSSGELRMIMDNSANANWVKQIFNITFGAEPLSPPAPQTLSFLDDFLTEANFSQFDKKEVIGSGEITKIYKGISIKKLVELGVLSICEEENIFVQALDYNVESGTYADKKEYRVYVDVIDATIVFYEKENENWIDNPTAPELNGAKYTTGRNFKNMAAFASADKAMVYFELINEKFNRNNENGGIDMVQLLEYVNMWEKDNVNQNFVLTDNEGNTHDVSRAQMQSAKLIKKSGVRYLQIGDSEYSFLKLDKAADTE